MSGNPVNAKTLQHGLIIAYPPGIYLVEKVWLLVAKTILASEEIDTTGIGIKTFEDILKKGKVPKKFFSLLKHLIPDRSRAYWTKVFRDEVFPGKRVVEETFYAFVEAHLNHPDSGISRNVFPIDKFKRIVATGEIEPDMIPILPVLVINTNTETWINLMKNYHAAKTTIEMLKEVEASGIALPSPEELLHADVSSAAMFTSSAPMTSAPSIPTPPLTPQSFMKKPTIGEIGS